MALTLPSIFPVGYAGDYTDFLKAKYEASGDERLITGSVSIPSGTLTTTLIGLFPFRRGFKLDYGSTLIAGALGTSVTLSWGWLMYDSTQPGSSNTAGFVSASTAAAAGGVITPNVVAGATQDMLSDGWVVALIGGATTGTTNPLTFNCAFAYDISGVTN